MDRLLFAGHATTTILAIAYRLMFGIQDHLRSDVLGISVFLALPYGSKALVVLHEVVGSQLRLLTIVAVSIATGLFVWWSLRRNTSSKDGFENDAVNVPGLGMVEMKPMLFPSRTTHTRLFPAIHSFGYSYLCAGIPVGWKGSACQLLSVDNLVPRKGLTSEQRQQDGHHRRKMTWFSVESEDYLRRGRHEAGLEGKLDEYLSTQGVSRAKYPYAYFVTSPRVFGISFINPISFWYLYSKSRELQAMILEVNNTFDERRMYFMERPPSSSSSLSDTDSDFPDLSVFKNPRWEKDLHVSPFSSRDGSYSVTAHDPFARISQRHTPNHSDPSPKTRENTSNPAPRASPRIDNNIVLHSPEGKPKVIARIFSSTDVEQQPLDAQTMTTFQSLLFMARWWWVPIMTDLRILREARKLWMAKGLQVFYRPEVKVGSIGRTDTESERCIEEIFGRILGHCADDAGVSIAYTAAAGANYGKAQILPPQVSEGDRLVDKDDREKEDTETVTSMLEIKILTPAFYTQLVHCSSTIFDALKHASILAPESERMVYTSDMKLCETIFRSVPRILNTMNSTSSTTGAITKSYSSGFGYKSPVWSCLQILRHYEQSRNMMDFLLSLPKRNRKESPSMSDLDRAVMQFGQKASNSDVPAVSPQRYVKAGIEIILIDMIAFGFPSLLKLWTRIGWLFCCLSVARCLDFLLGFGHRGQ